jgi:ribosome recycling factor
VTALADEDVEMVVEETKSGMEKALRSLRAELQKVRTGRASAAMLDSVQVDYYGSPTPLNQLANLATPDPRLIVISPYDTDAFKEIEKAILKADLGLSPSNDGKVVRVPVPPLTEERRKELVKHVHKLGEERKVGVREARRDGLSLLKDLVADGLSEDDKRREEKKIQALTDDFVKQIDDVTAKKEVDILQV